MRKYLDYKDVLILPRMSSVSSRKDVNLTSVITGKRSKASFVTSPVMVTNMFHTGTIEMANAKAVTENKISVCLHKFYSKDELIDFYKNTAYPDNKFLSIGMSSDGLTKLKEVQKEISTRIPILVDVANGYLYDFVKFIENVRNEFKANYLAAGNIATTDPLDAYVKAGVDAVRVGIGPGGQCRTRETAGVGVPQFTAVENISYHKHYYQIQVIADGGIVDYADFSKAIVAGADFVCAGSIFAGHDESGGELLQDKEDKLYKYVYGMSSEAAMKEHYGEISNYRASEGRVSKIPYKGPVENTIRNILGSMASTMTYTNCKQIVELQNRQYIVVQNTINRHYENNTVGI